MKYLLAVAAVLANTSAVAAPTYLIADKMIDPATGSVIDSPALVSRTAN